MMVATGHHLVATLAVGLVGVSVVAATDDWPHWRGPNYDGVSPETMWRTDIRPEPLWKTNVGLGHSTCTVVDGQLFVFGYDADEAVDVIRSLDSLTGAEHWRFSYPATLDAVSHSGGTHSSPTVANGLVYVSNRVGVLRCLDASTGKLKWIRDLSADFDAHPTGYGFGGSPLVIESLVICNVSKVVALDKMTGESVWQTRDLLAKYSNPIPFTLENRPAVASFTKEGLYLLALIDGKVLRHFPWRKGSTTVNAATPIIVDDRIFISSAYNHGCAMVEFEGGKSGAVWESRVIRSKFNACVRVDGLLFGFDESVFKCIDLDGKERWRKRGLGMGTLSVAGDRLLILSERGELVIASASADGYQELARSAVLKGGVCWATPVLVNGLIYCRNSQGDLICLNQRPE